MVIMLNIVPGNHQHVSMLLLAFSFFYLVLVVRLMSLLGFVVFSQPHPFFSQALID